MNLKHVKNVLDGKAIILLYGEIGQDPETLLGINGRWVASEIDYLQYLDDVSEIEVRINSHGGLVFDALSIFNAIRDSKKPCNTVIDGIAASSAGLIAMAGHKRYMNDFGRLMVHAPSIPDKDRDEMDEKTLKGLDSIADVIAELLTKNSKKSKDEIVKMIEAETWLTAEEALSAGFVDEIIDTDRNFDDVINELSLNDDLKLVVNQISNKLNKKKMSLESIKNKLGLDKNVSENVVNEQVDKIVNELKSTKEKLEAAEDNLKKAQDSLKETTDKAAVDYVENAIKDGKYKEEQREALIEQAKNNFELFQTLTESMTTKAARAEDHIDAGEEGEREGSEETDFGQVVNGKLDGKSFRELEKENPALLAKIQNSNKELFTKLYEAQYKPAVEE